MKKANNWSQRYKESNTPWDIGNISTPLKEFIDTLTNKKISILIPGAGNSYEAEYLFNNGFLNVNVVDIALEPLQNLKKRVPNFPSENLFNIDFFEHSGKYDLILEQTFFCALPPENRGDYAKKMATLLKKGGKLAGVLFNFPLTKEGPPFGGHKEEYEEYFKKDFIIEKLEICTNSIAPRRGRELFFIFRKN